MLSMKGTIYEQFPLLAFTPFGMWDILMSAMFRASVDNMFKSYMAQAPLWMGESRGNDFVPQSLLADSSVV